MSTLLCSGEGPSTVTVDPAYVQTLYDDMASAFEHKLVDNLGYRGPWILLEMVEDFLQDSHGLPSSWRILDMGCGSGLVGRVFSKFVSNHAVENGISGELAVIQDEESLYLDLQRLLFSVPPLTVGVDVSEAIAKVCISNGGYQKVFVGDLRVFLRAACTVCAQSDAQDRRFDLIAAADTFIYIGILGTVFAQVLQVIKLGGFFVFSVEDLDSSPFKREARPINETTSSTEWTEDGELVGAVPGWGGQLLTSARFAHSHAYIIALADRYHFECLSYRSLKLRLEGTVEVNGLFYLLQRVE
jgi:predicted TPR repeat methyltransferase